MPLSVVTPPTEEPLSLAETKRHLRVEHTDDDADITDMIKEARQFFERMTQRFLVTQTLQLTVDAFPTNEIRIPYAPVQSIAAILYDDENGDEQTLDAADYQLDAETDGESWVVAGDDGWPATLSAFGAVRVQFVAGYGAASAVPANIKRVLKLIVGHFYDNRSGEGDFPQTIRAMTAQHLLWM